MLSGSKGSVVAVLPMIESFSWVRRRPALETVSDIVLFLTGRLISVTESEIELEYKP